MNHARLFDLPPPDPDPVIETLPGQVVDTRHGRFGRATAVFSPCRTWRYRLSRVWDPDRPRVNFVMLNPSTADATQLDPTVRRCVGFGQAWGAGSVCVTNCFALRSTDPAGLRQVDDPVGPGNDDAVVAAASTADMLVVAWGVHATYLGRAETVTDLLAGVGKRPLALRVTRDGHPGHPLYVQADVVPKPWR